MDTNSQRETQLEQLEKKLENQEGLAESALTQESGAEEESLKKANSLDVNGTEYLKCKTIEAKYRWATAYIKGGMVPKGYENPAQVLAGLEFARELKVPPLVGLKCISIIHGMPSIFGDLPLALVRRAGKLSFIEEFIFDRNYKKICFDNKNLSEQPYGAICRTKRADQEKTYETCFTLKDAEVAGLLGRNNPWKTYPKRMLQMRARSSNLKDQFPDDLLGVSIAEYDFNTLPEGPGIKDVNYSGEEKINPALMINESLNE